MSPQSDNSFKPTITELESTGPVSRASDLEQAGPEDGWAFARYVFKHPVIILCCLYGNLGAAMYGFDNLSVALCLTMAPFLETFGVLEGKTYGIPAYWQSLWNAIPQIAAGIGGYIAGPISDRFGRRLAFVSASLFSFAGVAVLYTCSTRGVFLAGKIINSTGFGIALTVGQTYVSEITPTNMRGLALSAYTISMNLGYMIAASIAFARVDIPTDSGYKVLFALEWIWPVIMIIGAFIIPESPYHLARKNDMGGAHRSLSRLYPKDAPVEQTLQSIMSIIDRERYIRESSSSFIECFKGINWRRTRIVLWANGLNQMIGITFMNNSPYFMIVAGMSSSNSAMLIEVGIAMSILSSLFTFWAMAVFHRRTIMLGGITFAGLLFFSMGVAASIPIQTSASLWCVAVCLQMIWLTIGPVVGPAMATAGEVSAVKLRAETLALGFLFAHLWSTVWNIVVPYMYTSDEGDLGGKTGWIFFATSIIGLIIVWYEFPETKGLTFSQIDSRFEMRIPARNFLQGSGGEPDSLEAAKMDSVE